MAIRHTFAWFIMLIGVSATIFYFIQNEDALALNILFLSIYTAITILYFLRIFYYVDHHATLNEIYFISLANIIPLAIIFVSRFFPIFQEVILSFEVIVIPSNEFIELHISVPSLLAFPYLVVSTALLIRSFTRYQFIRFTSQSERGPSAEWTAIFTFLIFGILFLIAGAFASDLLGILYGFFFIFSGIGFILGK
ncbi:MAG: hypothetical protein ACXAB2_03140 [Candidatus Hodarchaeales archaeon]|jgi:hypothetical protein